MISLIDADTPCYASAAMAEGQEEQIAIWNVNNALDTLFARLGNPEYKLYVTGEGNYRFRVYPEYKANRLKVARPTHLQAVKDHLIVNWGAIESNGCEADDLLGIEQTACNVEGHEDTQIVSIDKDLDMIPGWHFSPEISRKGIVVKPERRYLVSPNDALRWFYTQLIVGDPTDNIKGIPGAGAVAAKRILSAESGGSELGEAQLFQSVREAYGNDEELEMNARCLWIQRYPDENIVERWKEMFGYQKED